MTMKVLYVNSLYFAFILRTFWWRGYVVETCKGDKIKYGCYPYVNVYSDDCY